MATEELTTLIIKNIRSAFELLSGLGTLGAPVEFEQVVEGNDLINPQSHQPFSAIHEFTKRSLFRGQVVRIRASGRVTDGNAAHTVSVRLCFGTIVGVVVELEDIPVVAGNEFYIDAYVTIRRTTDPKGPTGIVVASGVCRAGTSTQSLAWRRGNMTINSASEVFAFCTAKFSGTDVTNTIIMEQFIVERLGASKIGTHGGSETYPLDPTVPTPTAASSSDELVTDYLVQKGYLGPFPSLAPSTGGTGLFEGTVLAPTSFGSYTKTIQTEGLATEYTSAGVASPVGWNSLTTITGILLKPRFRHKMQALDSADSRYFSGFSEDANSMNADAPVTRYIGFSFSGSALRGDTNWKLIRDGNAGGGSQTIVDTGVVRDGTAKYFEVDVTADDGADTSSVTCRILDSAGVELYTTTVTTDLPGSFIPLEVVGVGTYNGTASFITWRHYDAIIENYASLR